jgi:uncharacterized protein (DUF2147 family)
MKRGLMVGAAALALWVPSLASAAPARDPSGVYLTEDGRARVQLEKCGSAHDQVCGYIVWLKTPLNDAGQPRVDLKNPDGQKAKRPLLGHQLILGLKPNDEGRYEGEIYNSEDGKKYDVTIWLDTPTVLKVKGCLVAFLCSTQSWAKTTDTLPGQLAGPAGSPTGPRPDPEYASATPAAAPGQPAARPKPRS